MITCTKKYTDIPFAHRQHLHDGHCAFIHGHNWAISITFEAKKLDENGFVVDFGKLKYIKKWIEENLDHKCLLCKDDPCLPELLNSKYFDILVVNDCSCEGLAKYVFEEIGKKVLNSESGRVFINSVTVEEDLKNSSTYAL